MIDNELSPAQQRAWEQDSNICVIDRQEVILDIFNMRARTKTQLQVELARMEYSLPRLRGCGCISTARAAAVVPEAAEAAAAVVVRRAVRVRRSSKWTADFLPSAWIN